MKMPLRICYKKEIPKSLLGQDTLMLVKAIRILSLLVRGFHTVLTERHLFARRKLCQL